MNISIFRQKLIIYIVLVVVTLAVFWQVNHFDFINFDDDIYVTQNPHVQSGFTPDGFFWAFSTFHAEFWHPLTWLSLMLDSQLYGLNAGGYHLTNIILHLISVLLLFWLFNRLTGSVWRSAFLTVLFAFHPLRVESVAWVAERKDVLSAFFWMLTLCVYVRYAEKPVLTNYLLVVCFFICGLMSKPMVVTLPVVMILLDYWPLGRFQSQKSNVILWQLKEKALFFILSAVFSMMTIYAQYNPSVKHFPLSYRVAVAPFAFLNYLGKIFWPHHLTVGYPFLAQPPFWITLGSCLLIIVISMAILSAFKRFPYLLIGWLWYSITILPVIGIIPIGDPMADRYIYLPSIGIGIMMAWGMPDLMENRNLRKKILLPAALIFFIIMSGLTWKQCGYWKNNFILFSHALRVTKNNFMAHGHLGMALFEAGKAEEAMGHYQEAIRVKPNYVNAYNNRGIAYANLGRFRLAVEDFTKAISLQSNCAQAYYNRGNLYYKFGQYQQAVHDYNAVIRLRPEHLESYYNRGLAYIHLGQYRLAMNNFNQAVQLKPDYADAWNNRAFVYLSLGNITSGCHDAQKACALGVCATLNAARGRGYCR